MSDLLKVQLIKKEKIGKDTWSFSFKKIKEFLFLPGQYVSIFFGNDTRDFTIASSPLQKDEFFIVTKEGISEFKNQFFSVPPGSIITLKSPSGGFVLDEKDIAPHVFLAGGIGMTPFYSMITYGNEKKLNTPMTLLVSFSKKEDVIFYNQLKDIAEKNPLINIQYSLSQDTWDGERGRISEKLIQKYVPKIRETKYLIAGGEKMVEDTEELLLKMGIDPKNIRIDIFTGY